MLWKTKRYMYTLGGKLSDYFANDFSSNGNYRITIEFWHIVVWYVFCDVSDFLMSMLIGYAPVSIRAMSELNIFSAMFA